MTLTLDLSPAEEAELRRLAAAGDLPAVRAALSDRLDDLAAGVAAAPAAGAAPSPDPYVVPATNPAKTPEEFERWAAEFAALMSAGLPEGHVIDDSRDSIYDGPRFERPS